MFEKIEDGFQYFHNPAIGCINDMCSWKPDITIKLRTADICPLCMIRLQERCANENIIKQSIAILESIRKKTLFSNSIRKDINLSEPLLPFPVAITKRKLDMTIEPLRKFLLLLDHFDSIIRTTVILFGKITLTNAFDDFFMENNLNDRPSLGTWVNSLQGIANTGFRNIDGNVNLDSEFFNRIKSILRKAEDDQIVRLRNQKRGHGYCDCYNASYKESFLKLSRSLECIENILTPFLIRCKCYYVESSNRIANMEFDVTVKPIMGNHPDFIKEKIGPYHKEGSDIPINRRIYVQFGENSRENNKWYDLHPYIIFDNCPKCLHQRVLIKDGQSYLDPYIGHLVKIDLNCKDHHAVT